MLHDEEDEKPLNFHDMELDDRILKAVAKLGWIEPTLIQEKAIPLLLAGKDVLIRAWTGSGKTAAFAIPVIQKILNSKITAKEQTVKALVLAPSRELCSQIQRNFSELAIKCSQEVQCVDISSQVFTNLKRKKDKESGVSRGIDFQFVSNVLNFDFPLDVNSYIHRVGRTARGNNSGTALSFVSMREMPLMKKVEAALQPLDAEESFFKAYEFKMEEVEGFRYRSKDAWRAVTRVAVREARLKEIKQEIMNSQVLKGYFEDNPNDYNTLRHDKALHTVRLQQHLTNVPEYLVPNELKQLTNTSTRKRTARDPVIHLTHTKKKFQRNKANPLMSFEFKGFKNDKQRKDQTKPHKSKKKKDIEFIDE
ncbi:Putative ATP-dependent RNA helicase me31b [Gryllus bimaculatus]|nr:Putative ATP-dependent RNA helicase me31b [Gryllus bimaculatus]